LGYEKIHRCLLAPYGLDVRSANITFDGSSGFDLKLGDAAGAYAFNVYDSATALQANINSDGKVSAKSAETSGGVTVGGALTVAGSAAFSGIVTEPVEILASSSNTTLNAYGMSVITTTGSSAGVVATLPVPSAGQWKVIAASNASTGKPVYVIPASSVYFGNGTNRKATLDAANEVITLVAQSTVRWQIIGNVGSVAFATT